MEVDFLHNKQLTTPWYLTFRTIPLKEIQLSKNKNRLALLRSAELQIITPPNTEKSIEGFCIKIITV